MVEKAEIVPNMADWWSQMYSPLRQFGHRLAEWFQPSSEAASSPDGYEISLELPGVEEKDIQVELHDGRLAVTGEKHAAREEKDKNFYFSERTYGSFKRVFRLPGDADTDRTRAVHKDGVLTIHIARTAPQTVPVKKVEISKA